MAKDNLSDKCGFKIVCLDCGRVLELKQYTNDVFKMKGITVAKVQDFAKIECLCGNQVNCYYG